jgi:GR25 family glycosyltransferase involved in LPS biosynthesis
LSESPPTSPEASAFWNTIDAVLIINLDHRIERWESLCAESEGLIPRGKLHRVPAVLGSEIPGFGQAPWFRGGSRANTWAARGGCVLAHRRAMELARREGWERILILEDDATFDEGFITSLDALRTELFESQLQWDICYLGFTHPQGPFQTVARLSASRHLARIYGCKCTHAYLVNATLRDWLLEQFPDESQIWGWLAVNRAIDRWYLATLGRKFQVTAISPSLIVQRSDFSDIVNRVTNHFGEDSGQLTIPVTHHSPTFSIRYFLRIQLTRCGRLYNYLSAIRKRFSGF